MLTKSLTLITFTIRESIRNKVYYLIFFFGIILLLFSLLLSTLGGYENIRILLNFGLAAIETISLIAIIFTSVGLILDEINTKSIYLVLARPVSKTLFLISRYIGLLISFFLTVFLMGIIHFSLLVYKGWELNLNYFFVIGSMVLKMVIVGAVAMFFSMLSTSKVSSFIFVFFFWIIGHFSQELKFFADKTHQILPKLIIYSFYYIFPNLSYFNWKDLIEKLHTAYFLPSLLYLFVYTIAYLFLAVTLFEKKEV